MNLTSQTHAIVFEDVPADSTCQDIIVKFLSSNVSRNKLGVSDKAMSRWKRALRLIHISKV